MMEDKVVPFARYTTTELGDALLVAAQSSTRRQVLRDKAKELNSAAAHAITLAFSVDSMRDLVGSYASAYQMLREEPDDPEDPRDPCRPNKPKSRKPDLKATNNQGCA